MLYKDQYLELTSWVPPTSTIYGLGERISSSGAPLFMPLTRGFAITRSTLQVEFEGCCICPAVAKTSAWRGCMCDLIMPRVLSKCSGLSHAPIVVWMRGRNDELKCARFYGAGLKVGRNGRPLAMWNRDCTDYPDLNLYGSHPFVLEVREGANPKPYSLVCSRTRPCPCVLRSKFLGLPNFEQGICACWLFSRHQKHRSSAREGLLLC